jgi:hypothetical protein
MTAGHLIHDPHSIVPAATQNIRGHHRIRQPVRFHHAKQLFSRSKLSKSRDHNEPGSATAKNASNGHVKRAFPILKGIISIFLPYCLSPDRAPEVPALRATRGYAMASSASLSLSLVSFPTHVRLTTPPRSSRWAPAGRRRNLTKGSALEILADLEARSQEPGAGMEAGTFTSKESQEPGGMAPPRLNAATLLKNP